jgi:hypothetical protein
MDVLGSNVARGLSSTSIVGSMGAFSSNVGVGLSVTSPVWPMGCLRPGLRVS